MTKKQKRMLRRILIAVALFAVGLFTSGYVQLAFMLAAWVVAGHRVVLNAAKTIRHGQVFDENFLMSIATVGAFILGEYAEGAAVMIFFQIGELFESCAVERSRRSIASLMDLRPDSAFVCRDDEIEEIDPEDVQPGDILQVSPGQRIAVDGEIIGGSASLDTSQITGESVPQEVGCGDHVLSGCINLSGVLKIRAESAYEHSTVARILELVEEAGDRKAKTERMITRFARYYTPSVVISAVVLAIVPSLITGQWAVWVERALSFLVISCPCALVISVPLSFFGGMGAASRQGIIVKGGEALEQLAEVKTAVFDKTGTLTRGSFRVERIHASELPQEQVLYWAASAEQLSAHPISQAIRQAVAAPSQDVRDIQELPGRGVRAVVDGRTVLVGNAALLEEQGVEAVLPELSGSAVHVALDGGYIGSICVADQIKPEASASLARLRRQGVLQLVMLTGDGEQAAASVDQTLGLDRVQARLLPQDKVTAMEALLAEQRDGTILFAGDGVNDAPVLTLADVGVAMGGIGSDAAVEAAEVVLLNDDLDKLVEAIRIAKKTVVIAKQNIVFALAVKFAVLILAVFGIANMWLAVFADVGVAVLAILNAMRTMRLKSE